MLTFKAPCGCTFYDSATPEIYHCPLHAAAREMRDLLQRMESFARLDNDLVWPVTRNALMREARALLAKVDKANV